MEHNRYRPGIMASRLLATPLAFFFASVLSLFSLSVAASEGDVLLDEWLKKQVLIKTWRADVVQTRKIKSLLRPLESRGQVWFVQPNQFRWQLGDPPRTIAVRTQTELQIVYPKLKQMERYPFDNISDPAMRQALALLEVGFPSDPQRFHSRYKLLSVTSHGKIHRFELQPKDEHARRLLTKVRLDVSQGELTLQATELEFPDGSTMRNAFSDHQLNVKIDDSLFRIDVKGYQVVEPLETRK